MSSILERPELNKIFLLYGNLDDMFFSPDLQRNNFRPFLTSYLQSLGYEQIVFYSGAKNTGKYVLDDRSALLAINKNRKTNTSNSESTAHTEKKKKRRIMSPNSGQTLQPTDTNNEIVADAEQDSKLNEQVSEIIHKQPKITPAEFLDDAKKMMADSKIKTAIVFPFFQDFVSDNSAPQQQYAELLSHLWDEYALNSNENICIFLAPQMDEDSISALFNKLQAGEVFKNRFFNSDETINTSCTLKIGLPNKDEFTYMLEYLRIVGDSGKRIAYKRSEQDKIVSALVYYSREANRKENRRGYLSAVYENIVWYMKQQSSDTVVLSENIIQDLYSSYTANESSDPLTVLSTTKGWESVAKRINEVVKDYNQKKARYIKSHANNGKPKKEKQTCSNTRIVPANPSDGFSYPIPHFILKGNPGVGKTTVARLIGKIFYDTGILKTGLTIEATRESLIDAYVGGTSIKTKRQLEEAENSVLFIDDAYSLIDNSEENNYSKQAIDEIVAAMTNPKQYHFCLIMAGYPEPMDNLLKMNSGLSSRFSKNNVLTIEDYKPELLKEIFVNNCKKDGYTFEERNEDGTSSLDLDLFFNNLYSQRDRVNFGNARDIVSIARDVKMKSSLRDDEARIISESDFSDYAKYFDKHGISSIDEIYEEIDKYVGLEFVKKLFEDVRYELLDVEDCKKRGVKPDEYPDHYIFSGNPGTGKTTVGKMIGKFYHLMGVLGGAETMFVDASDLIGSHVGDSKNRTVAKIQEAIDHNSLLYIDEAYQITDSAYKDEIIGAMMTKMTENAADFKMIFGMYSNRVDDFLKLNSGLSRRLRIVNFEDYNPNQLVKIFDRTIQDQGRTITEEAHHLIELIMEYKYNTRTESFGNAGEVKKLVIDMKKLLLRRTHSNSGTEVDPYCYTKDDIPSELLDAIKDLVNPRSFDDIMETLNEQIGLSDIKDIILQKQEEIEYARRSGESTYNINPGYYFFVGNPGTGKSTSAKLFGECLRELGIVKTNNFYSCTAKDLIGQYVGETQPKTHEMLMKSMNGILFIDEAYSLSYADEHGANAGYKKEALEEIIAFMDDPEHRRRCCIILAGYEKDMQGLYKSNSGMRSRIEEVHFNDFSPEEMYQIFALFCKKGGYTINPEVQSYYTPIFKNMSSMEYFSNGRTARTVYEKTVAKLKRRVVHTDNISTEETKNITMNDLLSEEECYKIVSTD